jgi:hypothetical protein
MAAILGLDDQKVVELCQVATANGKVRLKLPITMRKVKL